MQRRSAVLITALLVLGLLAMAAAPALAQVGWAKQPMEWVIAKQLTITHSGLDVQQGSITTAGNVTAEGDMIVGDDLSVTDDVSIGGSLTASVTSVGDVDINGIVQLGAGSMITVTASMTIPLTTASVQPIVAAGAVTSGVLVPGDAGRVVTIYNTGTNAITIPDSTTNILSGNAVLGQYDTLTVLSDGSRWIEIAQVDN